MNLKHVIFLFLITRLSASDIDYEKGLSHTQRSPEMIERINKTFKKVNGREADDWWESGDCFRTVVSFEHNMYLKDLCRQAAPNSTVNYLDYGAGTYKGGAELVRYFLKDKALIDIMMQKNIKLVITGLGGEKYSKENVKEHASGIITEKRYGSVSLENLEDELKRLNIDEKFDVIFSRWTLIHFIDPLGSYQQLLDALKLNGIMAYSGFYMSLDGRDIMSNQRIMFRDLISVATHAGEFLLKLQDGDTLNFDFIIRKIASKNLPFKYSSLSGYIKDDQYGFGHSIASYQSLQTADSYELGSLSNLGESMFKYVGDRVLFDALKEFLPKEDVELEEESAVFKDIYKRLIN